MESVLVTAQPLVLRSALEPYTPASATLSTAIATPMVTDEVTRSPRNSARSRVDHMAERIGLRQPGQPGRRERERQHHTGEQHERQRNAVQHELTTSSLRSMSPSVYDSDENAAPSSTTNPIAMATPPTLMSKPNGSASTTIEDRLHGEHHDVAECPAEQQRRAADRGHLQPFDHSGAQLCDQREADERGAEQGEQDQQPGDEHVVHAS